MAELIAKGPFDGQEPVSAGGAVLAPLALGPIWSLALFPGQAKAAEQALKPLDLGFPAPGQWLQGKAGARLVWTGRDQAFLIGAEPPEALAGLAAITDQSDGWAALALKGSAAEAVLARLVPVDLRAQAFPPGRAIRAALNHMPAVILRVESGFEILTFRSMARTAWHELAEVQAHLAARAALTV